MTQEITGERPGNPASEASANPSSTHHPRDPGYETSRGGLPRGGRLFGPLFGLVFLLYPVYVTLASNPSLVRLLLAPAGAILFACGFLWLAWTREPLRGSTKPPRDRRHRAVLVLLVALVVTLALFLNGSWLVLFFHLNVAAGLTLPSRIAYPALAGLAALLAALASYSGMLWLVLPTVALGLWATAFARQLSTVEELRAAREELARLAVTEERLRFARDLHDLLGHSLALITLKTELAGRLLPEQPERASTEIQEVETVARGALRDVREAVAGYRQPTLDGELRGARAMLEAAGISCRIRREHEEPLPSATETVLAWTVREAVTNVIRHSRAEACTIRLERDDEAVHAEITDNGTGTPDSNTKPSGGSGLPGLAERAASVGGSLRFGPLPGGGFIVRASVPIHGPPPGGRSLPEEGR